jgi:long-subunit acyl-CoA synthetase (AMP-forming)
MANHSYKINRERGEGVACWCMEAATLCAAFQQTAQLAPDAVALRAFGSTKAITWREYAARVRLLAAAMAARGVRHGDPVALMMTNRPEFHLIDTAAIHLGAVPFSVYNTSSPEQIAHALTNSGARLVFVEGQFLARVTQAGVSKDDIVVVEELEAFETTGDPGFDFDAAWQAVRPDDLLTLIYTSGTTGPAKGVELTHANLLAESDAVATVFDQRIGERIMSYLPSAHVADRLSCHYLQMLYRAELTCVADPRSLAEALPQVRPTIWVAVPRVWEKMKARIELAVADAPAPRRALFALALRHSRRRTPVLAALLDRVVLARVRHAMGFDQLRWAMSGAAAIAPETLRFFLDLGIKVCEVWGMSETCGAGTVNPPGDIRVGTVGKALPGVELKLAEDGELLIRGPIVTRGYHHDVEQTAEAIRDGWLYTGDVCTIDSEGYVSIVDRKKELIINAAGKNMSPTNIENAVKVASPLVAAVIVIGDLRPYNVALMSLDPEAVAAFTQRHGEAALTPAIEEAVQAANSRLSRVEQIKRYAVLKGAWEPGGDELTPTLKLRRRSITAKYAAEIEALYG